MLFGEEFIHNRIQIICSQTIPKKILYRSFIIAIAVDYFNVFSSVLSELSRILHNSDGAINIQANFLRKSLKVLKQAKVYLVSVIVLIMILG